MPHAISVLIRHGSIGHVKRSNGNSHSIANLTHPGKSSSLERTTMSTASNNGAGAPPSNNSDTHPSYTIARMARNYPNCQSDKPESNIDNYPPCMLVRMAKQLREQTEALRAPGRLNGTSASMNDLPPCENARMTKELFGNQNMDLNSYVEASRADLNINSLNDKPKIDTLPPSIITRISRDLFREQTGARQNHEDASAYLESLNRGKRSPVVAQALDGPAKRQKSEKTAAFKTDDEFAQNGFLFCHPFTDINEVSFPGRKGILATETARAKIDSLSTAPSFVDLTNDDDTGGRMNGGKSSAETATAKKNSLSTVATAFSIVDLTNDEVISGTVSNGKSSSSQRAANAGFIPAATKNVLPRFHDGSGVSTLTLSNSSPNEHNIVFAPSAQTLRGRRKRLTVKRMLKVGWERDFTKNADKTESIFWLSPKTKMTFHDFKEARIFEMLRMKHREDEGLAWKEYSRNRPIQTLDPPLRLSSVEIMLNNGWAREVMTNAEGEESICWLSPNTRMIFNDFRDAKLFETLRTKHHRDEGLAWREYSSMQTRE